METELKKLEEKYAESIVKYANNKKIADNLRNAFPHPYTHEEAIKFIETCKNNDEKKDIVRAIVLNGEMIGTVGVFIKDDVYSLSAEIGYWLAEPFWGRGIMTKCVKELCGYVFKNYEIIRIFTEIFAFNTGSKRVLEKAGFQFEGVKRKAIFKNGIVHDSLAYAIIKDDRCK